MWSSSRPKLAGSKRPSRNGVGITGRTPLMGIGLLGRMRGTDGPDGVADGGDDEVTGHAVLGQKRAAVADAAGPGREEGGGVVDVHSADRRDAESGERTEQVADVAGPQARGGEELDRTGAGRQR